MSRPDRFRLGRIYLTQGAVLAIQKAKRDSGELISRHRSGDWGEIPEIDRQANEEALVRGGRILSAYRVGASIIWVNTDPLRTITVVMLPDEY